MVRTGTVSNICQLLDISKLLDSCKRQDFHSTVDIIFNKNETNMELYLSFYKSKILVILFYKSIRYLILKKLSAIIPQKEVISLFLQQIKMVLLPYRRLNSSFQQEVCLNCFTNYYDNLIWTFVWFWCIFSECIFKKACSPVHCSGQKLTVFSLLFLVSNVHYHNFIRKSLMVLCPHLRIGIFRPFFQTINYLCLSIFRTVFYPLFFLNLQSQNDL